MARKARQRISYVLPLANSAGGHRLGVNGLAVDSANSLLYSGGRDGVICAWDLNLDLENATALDYDAKIPQSQPTTFRNQVQAHTHWINDIALAHSNQALVSASSDVTVKVWRPAATDGMPPQTIGLHSDYVKTLAVPYSTCDWVASGGLDRKISLWDLNGAGQKLSIDVAADEAASMLSKEKGSVYALAATNSLLASGGPESTVRVWDCRTGKRVTKLVGHTDNIRDILVSQDGSTILTASSDRTVKVWSTIAGRCMFTLTMHDASVWSLFSSDPDLSIFYSSDKTGLIAKTDTRNTIELDEGLSVAVGQEHEGVHKVVTAGDCIWTATSRPSINRWRDVNTDNAEIEVPENYNTHRLSSATARSRYPSPPTKDSFSPMARAPTGKRQIPLKHALRLSNTAYFPTPLVEAGEANGITGGRRSTLETLNQDTVHSQPVRAQPELSVEGQNGLIKHVMLNDRKRVLTLDTAGEVVMWDLLKCVPIKSFGKRHLEDVKDEVTTTTAVANWCTVDTRTGSVAVVLEENTCFDAEMYADELDLDANLEFREDQRINLGKWVLRYLFNILISEETKRDEAFRKQLLGNKDQRLQRDNAPSSIQLPQMPMNGWQPDTRSATTPKANGNGAKALQTPGLNIGLATPGAQNSPLLSKTNTNNLPTTADNNFPERSSSQSHRQSGEKGTDYFSTSRIPNTELTTPGATSQPATTPHETHDPSTPTTEGPPKDGETPKKGMFGKKFSMGMSFSGMKKLGKTTTNTEKPAPTEEDKVETESDSHSSKTSNSRQVDDNFLGTIQKIRFAYEDSLQQQMQSQQAAENGLPITAKKIELPSAIAPSLPADTPVLKPPLNTTILIQEDRPEAGGVADLFEGTVGQLGEMADLVERAAPMWLAEVLLRNQIPAKDIVKISFILEPWQNELPSIAADGNNRLNANRMLRARKIMSYVADRIEPASAREEDSEEAHLKPEEYLELWCQNQLVPPTMTLMTIRSHLWRGGGDVVLYYKSNGRKTIRYAPPVQVSSGYPPTNTSAPERENSDAESGAPAVPVNAAAMWVKP
ncbi:UBP9-binding protein [Fulvia fulva]|uniref:UBP9-binding protein n=1 Tax=Passalora fulva TaxID=5499 RepID=A0A9Q8USZ5_PASFU|nr:UBP9-binding protein [Fulvia fulva]KAK4619037.1 UBP9-binding protein [Fulvia fulva]UJO21384.1 UBP9-binding protein [Fulvia fulva]WPV18310.1 UBP9-binding protein [Fulvia fulva]WPV33331.1 UBP9-binding protein [Fulvia fulva]